MTTEELARAAREVRETCVGMHLRMAARAVTQHYDDALADVGLRSTQFSVLIALAHADAMPLSKVAEVLVMDRTTLTRNVAPLLRDGFVEERASDDRRVRKLGLTAKGRAILTRALPRWRDAQARMVRALSAEDRTTLRRILGEAVQAVRG
jgi:DNA-binding MarR family transcriptional regulator